MSETVDLNYCNAHHFIALQRGRTTFYASVNENYHRDFDGIGADDSYTVVLLHPDRGTMIFTLDYDYIKEKLFCPESKRPEDDILNEIINRLPYK